MVHLYLNRKAGMASYRREHGRSESWALPVLCSTNDIEQANVYPLPVALTAKDFETTKPGESGSEAGNSQANLPDDDMRDSPWEPVEESPQTREAPTARMMESKRSFLIPRAPKFEVESTD